MFSRGKKQFSPLVCVFFLSSFSLSVLIARQAGVGRKREMAVCPHTLPLQLNRGEKQLVAYRGCSLLFLSVLLDHTRPSMLTDQVARVPVNLSFFSYPLCLCVHPLKGQAFFFILFQQLCIAYFFSLSLSTETNIVANKFDTIKEEGEEETWWLTRLWLCERLVIDRA